MIVRLVGCAHVYCRGEIWEAPPGTILILLNADEPFWHVRSLCWSYRFISENGIGHLLCHHLSGVTDFFEELVSE